MVSSALRSEFGWVVKGLFKGSVKLLRREGCLDRIVEVRNIALLIRDDSAELDDWPEMMMLNTENMFILGLVV